MNEVIKYLLVGCGVVAFTELCDVGSKAIMLNAVRIFDKDTYDRMMTCLESEVGDYEIGKYKALKCKVIAKTARVIEEQD